MYNTLKVKSNQENIYIRMYKQHIYKRPLTLGQIPAPPVPIFSGNCALYGPVGDTSNRISYPDMGIVGNTPEPATKALHGVQTSLAEVETPNLEMLAARPPPECTTMPFHLLTWFRCFLFTLTLLAFVGIQDFG